MKWTFIFNLLNFKLMWRKHSHNTQTNFKLYSQDNKYTFRKIKSRTLFIIKPQIYVPEKPLKSNTLSGNFALFLHLSTHRHNWKTKKNIQKTVQMETFIVFVPSFLWGVAKGGPVIYGLIYLRVLAKYELAKKSYS